MKLMTIIMLLILTVFVMGSVAQAEDCTAGKGEDKWTVYLAGNIFHLKGSICIFDTDTAEWKGVTNEGNNIYFSGTYALVSGHHEREKIQDLNLPVKDDGKRIGW